MSESLPRNEFDQLVDTLLPYLTGSTKVFGASTDHVLQFRKLLSRFRSSYRDIGNRGPAFEKLRKFATADSRNLHNDPRDGIGVKLALRVFAGKRDSDEAVLDFLREILEGLDHASHTALMELALSDEDKYLESENNALEVMNFIATRALSALPMTDVNEAQFSERVVAFQELTNQSVMNSGMVGNIMARRGIGSVKDAEKARRRNTKGKYLESDFQILTDFLFDTFQPRALLVTRFQRKMGWVVNDWVSESAVNRLRNAVRQSL